MRQQNTLTEEKMPIVTEENAYLGDMRWLAQNNGKKHDPVVFHDVVNRFMADGEKEAKARALALASMNKALVKRL